MKGKRDFFLKSDKLIVVALFLIEVSFLFLLFSSSFTYNVVALIGGNVTVTTRLNVGNAAPEILNITFNMTNGVTLVANSSVNVTFQVLARDFNGESSISNVTAQFFDNVASSYGDTDDNNDHYTNNNCTINTSYGDQYEINATCIFSVWYYANNATWNITVQVMDNSTLNDTESNITYIHTLLALGLPPVIDYGVVNVNEVSNENITNVTNFGNVYLNLTLEGYAVTEGDNLSMNCTLGATKNISIYYEKYNLTTSTGGALTLPQFEAAYINLTADYIVKAFSLRSRVNDTVAYREDTNQSYWRIYVPTGVAGTCQGNVIFGATLANGS